MVGDLVSGETAYYRFSADAGETLRVSLSTDTPASVNDIFLRYGEVPTIGLFDATSNTPAIPDPEAVIDASRPGTYYVMVRGSSVPSTEHYTLLAETVPFSISAITPDHGSNRGSVTLTIDGAKFNANEHLEVVAEDGTAQEATEVRWVDSTQLWATFDLQGLPTGNYDVRIHDDTRTASLDDAFDVTNGLGGHLAVNLVLPGSLRPGQSGIARIDYANDGGTDVPAPIIDLNAVGALLKSSGLSVTGTGEVTFLAANSDGPSGILQPGAHGSATFAFTPTIGSGAVQFSLGTLQPSETVIDWGALEDALRPAVVDATDWDRVWSQFEARVGTTASSLLAALSQDATELSQVGQPTTDINTLLQYELLQASGALPKTYLTGATDLGVSSPGLDLALTRLYNGTLLARNDAGAFGDGWTFSYDISAVTDANGNVFIQSPGGLHFFTRQSDGHFTAQAGDTTTLSVSGGAYVLTGINGAEVQFHIDGKLDRITDTNGNAITAHWNASGQLQSLTQSAGQSLTFTHNAAGRIVSATDSDGRTVTYTYDAAGTHLLSASGTGGVTTYDYNTTLGSVQENALTGMTYPDGTHHYFEYDAAGRLAAEFDDGGSGRIEYSYDGAGHVAVTDALGNETNLFYDANGKVAQVQDALGRATQLQHDAVGDLTQAVTPGNGIHAYSYDPLGNLLGYADPLGGEIAGTYAPGTQLLSDFSDQLGNAMQYTYDAFGNLKGISYEDGSGTHYEYTAEGFLDNVTNARGQSMHYTYDAAGRLIEKDFSDGTAERYVYDAHGNLISAEARDNGISAYTYDGADRLTSVTDPGHRTEWYTYDSGGRRVEHTNPDGSATAYSYDAAGRLSELHDGSDNLLVVYSYDAAGRLIHVEMGNGASTAYTYLAAGEIVQILDLAADSSVTSRFDYSYDANSRVIGVSSLDGDWTYTYDASGQLTQALFDSINAAILDQDLLYIYDAAGNRIRTVENGVVTDYTTNNLNQYVSVDGATYTYDADSNLAGKTTGADHWTYSYDEENHLVGISGPDGNWTYEYDALGNRVATVHDGVRSEYVIDPFADSIVQQYDGAGNAVASYIYGYGLEASTGIAGSNAYYNTDLTGNVTGLSGADGNLIGSYSYLPFGEIASTSGSLDNPFQFSGGFGVTTDGTGLDFMRARFFDSSLGRFVSRDPIGITGGTNLYAYVDNDPATLTDPTGQNPLVLAIGFAGVVGGVAGVISQVIVDGGKLDFNKDVSAFTGGFVGGGVYAAVAIATKSFKAGSTAGGAAGAAVKDITSDLLNDKPIDWTKVEQDALGGAVLGAVVSLPIPGVTSGQNSWQAIARSSISRLASENIGDVSLTTFLKSIGAGLVWTCPGFVER
jgi:RHS repeat-associated protein